MTKGVYEKCTILNHNCTRWYDCLVLFLFVTISFLRLKNRFLCWTALIYSQNKTFFFGFLDARLQWRFNYDWCVVLWFNMKCLMFRCGGVMVAFVVVAATVVVLIMNVGANSNPLLHCVRMCVPKGCLQISFSTV